MKTMTQDEFLAEAKARFGEKARNWKFVCPMCGTIQSVQQLLDAVIAAGGTKEDVHGYIGFSCIGRFTGQSDAGIAAKNRGDKWDKGCNWTLGGLLQCHELEVVMPDGHKRPTFELAEAERRHQRPRHMNATIANLDAMARFSAWICSAVRTFRVQKKSENSACNTHRWVYAEGMKVTKQNHPVLPAFSNGLTAQDFNRPTWNKYAGAAGGFVAESRDGQFEAIAEPLQGGWQFWLVRTSDGETLQEASCAA